MVDSLGNTSLRGERRVIKVREAIGTKGLLFMQIESKLPYDAILSKMFYSLLVFALIIMFVVGCLIHQLRVIRQKDELLERREVSVNGIVHDLKSPLNALVTLTGWLMETESDLRKKELMAEVIKRAGHQTAQIESILVCARGAAQPIVLNKTEINPEEIVQAAIDDICVELKAKPHSIEVINEASGLTCLGDRGYLENVMKNLIENALKEAKEKLKSWNMEREDSILNNWIFQTAFFSKKYVKQDFIYNESDPTSTQDFYSVFDQQWRTTVNKVDLDNPVELSNGVAYKITSLKIPTNKILIWRIKERFETFDQLTDEDKKYYYPGYNYISTYLKDIGENVQMNRVKQYVGANQPKPWLPAVYCRSMMLWVVDTDRPGIFKFKCYRLVEDKASTTGFIKYLPDHTISIWDSTALVRK